MSAKARAIETLIGTPLGGALGGLIAGATYRTDQPLEWMGPDATVQGRELTPEELSTRRKRWAKGVVIGALGGAGAALGGSAARQQLLRQSEQRFSDATADPYLRGLRALRDELVRKAKGTVRVPFIGDRPMKRRAAAAEKLLQQQEAKVKELLDEASKVRGKRAFGGEISVVDKAHPNRPRPHPDTTHTGLVHRHFADLGISGVNMDNDIARFRQYIEKNAFADELSKIAAMGNIGKGLLGAGALAATGGSGFHFGKKYEETRLSPAERKVFNRAMQSAYAQGNRDMYKRLKAVAMRQRGPRAPSGK